MLALTSCSSKLGELSADNFTVTPNPLESRGGQVPVTINGNFPEKYLKKKAVVTVVPELRYGDGQVAQGQAATFQGEKVEGNDQTISYKMGGNYTMKSNFKYVPEMHKSDLYMTFDAYYGKKKKKIEVPAVKVAEGVISTSELYKNTLAGSGARTGQDRLHRFQQGLSRPCGRGLVFHRSELGAGGERHHRIRGGHHGAQAGHHHGDKPGQDGDGFLPRRRQPRGFFVGRRGKGKRMRIFDGRRRQCGHRRGCPVHGSSSAAQKETGIKQVRAKTEFARTSRRNRERRQGHGRHALRP